MVREEKSKVTDPGWGVGPGLEVFLKRSGMKGGKRVGGMVSGGAVRARDDRGSGRLQTICFQIGWNNG
ncbi:hypothetical protein PLACP1_01590 [Planifilum fimeticola]